MLGCKTIRSQSSMVGVFAFQIGFADISIADFGQFHRGKRQRPLPHQTGRCRFPLVFWPFPLFKNGVALLADDRDL